MNCLYDLPVVKPYIADTAHSNSMIVFVIVWGIASKSSVILTLRKGHIQSLSALSILDLWSYLGPWVVSNLTGTRVGVSLKSLESYTIYGKTCAGENFVVFHSIANLFLRIMAFSIGNTCLQKFYSERYTVNSHFPLKMQKFSETSLASQTLYCGALIH